MIKKLLIATHNPAKLKELKISLKPLKKKGIKILSLDDLKITSKPEETGTSFKQNAQLKAKYYASLTNLITISDDGGLCIKELNGEPGVKSRNWLGYEATDEELIIYALKRLKRKTIKQRRAYLETCVCLYNPKDKKSFFESKRIYGYIAKRPTRKRELGYPFRSLFIIKVKNRNKYYNSLSGDMEEVNHRMMAAKRLINKIKNYLLK
jgi:XTP/dITP diphosphohydrolase